ncbi:MAG: acetyl-CoA C-acyltransferase [Firmicutes bacterium]|nr:acetyl-CoA C-acyltransferase [Bacillota bacterium]
MEENPTREAFIVDAVRTPIGRHGGALASVRPDDLAALVIRALVDRNRLVEDTIDDVYFGCANQAGEDNRNVARMALLLAGLPTSVPGATVNRLCGSGLETVAEAARAVMVGEGDLFIAGGVERMTRAPYVLPKPERGFERGMRTLFDTTLGWRMVNPKMPSLGYDPIEMGETAENVAEQYNISRESQDRFAFESQQKTARAMREGSFEDEIVPASVPQRKGTPKLVIQDEHPRPQTTIKDLAKLKPAFRENGTVTAGNSSGINDGATAVLVMSQEKVAQLGLTPLARILTTATAGVHPNFMGLGPIPATQKALKRVGLSISDLDLIELNEVFAAQSLACIQELGLPIETVNVHGGAIALGHPLGCSGARILTTLVHEMKRRLTRYGLATMCIGVGQGIAMVVERNN